MQRHIRISIWSVIVITGAVALTAILGSLFTSGNRDWYERLSYPSFKPPDWVIPIAWNIIFLCSIIALILVWNTRPHSSTTRWVVWAAVLNATVNIAWSALFFGNRLILPAVFDSALLFLTTVALIVLAWPINRIAAVLFIPYAAWVAFATVLTWGIWVLNR